MTSIAGCRPPSDGGRVLGQVQADPLIAEKPEQNAKKPEQTAIGAFESRHLATGDMQGYNLAETGCPRQPGAVRVRTNERSLWCINRLRSMTPAEIGHRIVRVLAMLAERAGLIGSNSIPPPDLASALRRWVHATAKVDAALSLAAADRIAAGKVDVFALKGVDLGSPLRWNRDPKTGVEAPLVFGKLIDYRNPQLVGDIKYLWEVNRHLHLVTLAQAYALSGNVGYFNVIRQHLESWFTACPYRMGPNWSSALEAAIRLINWSVTWQLLVGARSTLFRHTMGARFWQRWLESIYQHGEFVRGYFSLHSSANNHLIGEAAGLFIAALTWPHSLRTRGWLLTATAILQTAPVLPNAPDRV